MLYIEGKIRTSSWEDGNGEKKYSTEIIADKLQMLGKKDDEQPREKTQTRPPVSKPLLFVVVVVMLIPFLNV